MGRNGLALNRETKSNQIYFGNESRLRLLRISLGEFGEIFGQEIGEYDDAKFFVTIPMKR